MAVTGAVSILGVKTVHVCSDYTRSQLGCVLSNDSNSFLACWQADESKAYRCAPTVPKHCISGIELSSL
jgi:hypothetical protein